MLRQVLQAIETADGPVELEQLSRRLDIERGVLDGIIDYWVRKGRLRRQEPVEAAVLAACSGGACGIACAGPQACPHATRAGQKYSLVVETVNQDS